LRLREIETHCHTREVSPCSRIPAAEIVRLYHEKGYAGVFITDHFTSVVFEDPKRSGRKWEEQVDLYLAGYKAAKAEGDRLGIRVFLGLEVQPASTPFDFLVYGVDEAFIKEKGPFYKLETRDFYHLMHINGKLVFQAHPYRYGLEPEEPKYIHGVEIFNAHPRHQSRNNLALKYAFDHNLWTIAGSDVHQAGDIARSGVMLPESVDSESAFVDYYRQNGSPELIITMK
jgi:predicted metal-dependent phosphoesterase TrpH